MAFSLKSLLKGRKKGPNPMEDEEDDTFLSAGPEEITESEAIEIERADAARKAKMGRKKQGLLAGLLAKFGKGGKNRKKGAASEPDPFDNPELLALIASEVAAIPMPDAVAEIDPKPEVVSRKKEVSSPPPAASPADLDDEMIDDEQPVEEDLPAFMSKPDRNYQGMPDFDMPEASKGMGYDGDDDPFAGGFPIGGLDHNDRPGASTRRGSGKKKAQRLAALAAGVLAVVALGGGGAWWFLSGDESPARADGGAATEDQAKKGGSSAAADGMAVPKALPGERISMAMPPPPADGAAGSTERSSSRRPWLTDGATPLGPDSAPGAAAPGAGAPPPASEPPKAESTKAEEPKAAETKPTEAKPAETAHGPSDGLAPSAGHMTVEAETPAAPQGAGKPPSQPGKPVALAALPPMKELPRPGIPDGKSTPPSYEKLPKPQVPSQALAAAPVNELARQTAMGLLPVRAADGRTPWQTYARPFNGDAKKPRIALLVVGLGLDQQATMAAITSLPAEVTLSFSPYAPNLSTQMAAARAAGHEVMLDLPMEPPEFPSRDPGPLAMLTTHGAAENVSRLEMALGKGVGYTGVVNRMGGKFTASADAMRPVLKALGERGLLYINSTPQAAGVLANQDGSAPISEAILTVDQDPFRAAIDGRLAYLQDAAKARGRVVAVVSPSPLSFDRVIAWSKGLADKGVQLAPVSAALPGGEG